MCAYLLFQLTGKRHEADSLGACDTRSYLEDLGASHTGSQSNGGCKHDYLLFVEFCVWCWLINLFGFFCFYDCSQQGALKKIITACFEEPADFGFSFIRDQLHRLRIIVMLGFDSRLIQSLIVFHHHEKAHAVPIPRYYVRTVRLEYTVPHCRLAIRYPVAKEST